MPVTVRRLTRLEGEVFMAGLSAEEKAAARTGVSCRDILIGCSAAQTRKRARFPAVDSSTVPVSLRPARAFRLVVSNLRFPADASPESAMDIDPLEMVAEPSSLEDAPPGADHRKRARLNAAVAITVALLATFMGICKIKDDNICQAMQQAQADKIDHWSYYQARNVRQEIAEATATQLRLQQASQPAAAQAAYAAAIARYDQVAKDQAQKKDEVKAQAVADQANYDGLNYRDDQFDLSDALLAIAISMLAVSALTQLMWLYLLSLVPSGFGVLMGVAGLVGMHIHPDRLSALLS